MFILMPVSYKNIRRYLLSLLFGSNYTSYLTAAQPYPPTPIPTDLPGIMCRCRIYSTHTLFFLLHSVGNHQLVQHFPGTCFRNVLCASWAKIASNVILLKSYSNMVKVQIPSRIPEPRERCFEDGLLIQ